MTLLILFIIPCVISLGAYLVSLRIGNFRYKITFNEFLIQLVITLMFSILCYFISIKQKTTDYEVWNSKVTSKSRVVVSCSHSYLCRCRLVKCGKDCRTTHCDTCYEHSYDVSWQVHTSSDENFYINRVDRQGTTQPPRWTKVNLGDNTALVHSYTNYIKANPWSLLNRSSEPSSYLIPDYPIKTYDYHYIDRFVSDHKTDEDSLWNLGLQALNSEIGVEKKVNVSIVVTKNPQSFSYDLQNSWLGGKKNDVIVVIGYKEYPNIDWVRVLSWSSSERLKVDLREEILSIRSLSYRDRILSSIKSIVKSEFTIMNMEDFKYLISGLEPDKTAVLIIVFLQLVVSGVATVFFINSSDMELPWEKV